jgi:CRP-like cAMP-binding protein
MSQTLVSPTFALEVDALPSRPPRRTSAPAHPLARLSVGAREAWQSTFFASMPPDVTGPVLERAVESTIEAGEIFYRGAHHADTAMFAIVIEGLLRFYIAAPDGRAMTVRYAGRGELVGARGIGFDLVGQSDVTSFGRTALNGEALERTRILTLPKATVVKVARSNAAFSWELVKEIAAQATRHEELMAANVFSPIRPRVALHLINLAIREGDDLVVAASHQEIANSIGSVREVVSRALCRFQAEGLVTRRGRRLVLADIARLHAISLD